MRILMGLFFLLVLSGCSTRSIKDDPFFAPHKCHGHCYGPFQNHRHCECNR